MFKTNISSLSPMIKNLATHKILPAVLSVAMLSGFALTSFSNIIQPKITVNAAPTVLYSTDFGTGLNPGAAIAETDYLYYSGTADLNPGSYSVLNNSSYNNLYGGYWHTSTDHTGNTNGYMYITDGTTVPGLAVFKKTLNLSANYDIKIDFGERMPWIYLFILKEPYQCSQLKFETPLEI
jgi:hypothetical protein